jgi:translocation and assembly module TamB
MLAPDRESTVLPQVRTRKRRDWGRVLARVLCALFAVLGVLPVGVAFVLRSPWVRDWATRETSRILREQNFQASYQLELHLWPLSVELRNIRLESTDGGAPALQAQRMTARPRLFSLLAGKLVIDQTDVESPKVRLVVKDGKVKNLTLPDTKDDKPKKRNERAPFGVFAMTDASVDIEIDDVRILGDEADLDVTVDNEDAATKGSAFEIALRMARASVQNVRVIKQEKGDPRVEVDDDALCMIDGRVRVERDLVLVRRFSAVGSADLDHAAGTGLPCDLPKSDKRRVELSLAHLRIGLPEEAGKLPTIEGHVAARAPLGLIMRLPGAPTTDGWIGVDGDVHFAKNAQIPDFTGHLEAHDLRVDRYRFSSEIQSDLHAQAGQVTSSRTMVRIAKGVATLSDVNVDLMKPDMPLRTRLDVKDVSFTALMQDLGVSQHPHVTWDLREVHVASFHGTLNPLHLDGEMSTVSQNFAVYDVAVEEPNKLRLTGFRESSFTNHIAVRPDALVFSNVHAIVGKGVVDGGLCSIGFHEDLRVEAPRAKLDLAEITPLANIPIGGMAEAEVKVSGKFSDPRVEGETKIENFVLGDIPFGNVTSANIEFQGQIVELKNVKAVKGKSPYEMSTARLDFGHGGMTMDGIATSSALSIRDFFALFHLEDDPRFLEIDGTLGARASIHLALDGPEDRCGGGYLDVSAAITGKNLSLFGEAFDDGSAELEYKWLDRDAGTNGAEIDIRAMSLHKNGRGGRSTGSVLGSATIRSGGELRGSVVLDALPLSRFGALGALANRVEGSMSGVVRVNGTLDAYRIDGDVDVTPVRIDTATMGSSQLHVTMTQNPSGQKPIGKTRCGAPTYPLFDREAYLRNTASQGNWVVSGTMFGGQIVLDHLTATRQKSAKVSGSVGFRKLDLAQISRIAQDEQSPETADVPQQDFIGGEVTGDLVIDRLAVDDIGHASVRFTPQSVLVTKGGQKLTMRPTTSVLTVENDALNIPALVFDLAAANGLKGAFTVKGGVTRLTRDAQLGITADLAPIDLGVLVGIVPKLTRAQGTLSGAVRVKGRAASPDLEGTMRVRGGELSIVGVPGVVGDLELDVSADENEIRLTRGVAKLLGGDVSVTGRVPIKGLTLGTLEANILAHDLHVVPQDGVKVTLDANLLYTATPAPATGTGAGRLPQLSGEVSVTSFEYTRPMLIALAGSLKGVGGASRTVVETYDPSLDAVRIDVTVRGRAPLKFKNNLIEVQLAVENEGLVVSGTNQRVGLKGGLRALQGGKLRVLSNDFEIKQATVRFDDPTRIAPNFDVVAVTEYRRYSSGAGTTSSTVGSTSGGTTSWRITAHVFGDPDNVNLDLTSEPPLSRDDIQLLLTVHLTRAELDQLRGASGYAGLAYEAAGFIGQDALKNAIPVVDDFRFGSAYSPRTGKIEPQVTASKRLTDDVQASVSKFLTEDNQLRSNVEWRLNRRLSIQGTFDNINSVNGSASGVGGVDIKNVGVDLRYRLEFE